MENKDIKRKSNKISEIIIKLKFNKNLKKKTRIRMRLEKFNLKRI
jgi:hypothetical protein